MKNLDYDTFKKLDGYASPVDSDRLWAQMQPQLPVQKRRIIPFWFFTTAFIGICLMAGAYYWSGSRKSIENNASEKPTTNTPVASAITGSNLDIAQTVSRIPAKERMQSGTQANATATTKEARGRTPLTITEKNRTEAIPEAEVITSREVELIQALATTDTKLSDLPFTFGSQTHSDAELHVHIPFLNKSWDRLPQANSVLYRAAQVSLGQRLDPQTGCYDWGRKKRLRPYIGVYAGGHYPLKSLRSKGSEHDAFADLRKQTETVLEAVNGGAFLGLEAQNGLSVDAGIEYLRINERFDFTSTRIDTIGQITTTGIIVNAPGDTTFIQETVDVTQTTVSKRRIYNRYNFVQIPVAIGYTLKSNGSITPYIKGGVQFNISTTQKAGMIDGANQILVFRSADAATNRNYPFKSQIGIAPFVQLGARYRISGPLEAFGELRYLHILKEITTVDHPVSQKYGTIGLQIGVRMGL